MNKKMFFIPSLFQALALVVCLILNFLSHAAANDTPVFSVSFSPTTIGPGSVSTMTYTIDNSAQATVVSGLSFTNTLPAGMTIASPDFLLNTCLNGSYSSTSGSNAISFSDYRLNAGASCSFQLDVTSSSPGTYTNTTGALSTSAGSAGTSSAILTVDDTRPGFSMAFSPATINPGAISTLTYTIDNSANSSDTNFQSFNHSLPTGLIFSQQPNITNNCSATVVAEPSSATLTGDKGAASAGATCIISVDVTAPSAGVYQTKSIGLSRFGSNPSGQASAELTVTNSFMFMTFPNASAPGATVDLIYTINNFDRVNAAENISFTNDLDATLSGLTATALPADGFCGAGSSLTTSPILDSNGRSTGISPITVTGANLSAEASCTFKVSVLIPTSAAAGNYTNSTSIINLTLGAATTQPAATNTLAIKKAPQVSMSFLSNPVKSGENLTLRYVVTNTDTTNSASDLNFTMPIGSIVAGMVPDTLPNADTCGNGSTFSAYQTSSEPHLFSFSGGVISAGGSCTFDLVLSLPADISPSIYPLTTSTIAGTVNGDTVYGNQAQDTLSVISAAKLSLAIVEEQIAPGGQVTLEFTLDYSESASADVSNLAFTVDLDAGLSGLTAVSIPSGDVCGAGSTISGSSILTFSNGSLSSANQCTFSVTLSVPNNAAPVTIKLNSSVVTGTTAGQAVNSAAASDTLVISALHLTKYFSPDVVLAGNTISLTYTLTNTSADATSIEFTDSMTSVIGSLQANNPLTDPCGVGSSITGTTSLTFAGGNLDSGASCTFTVDLQVPADALDGVYNSATSNVSATVNSNNTSSLAATATLEIQSLTALLTSTVGNPTASNPILVNINFSREVINFTVDDLVVNNATLANFSGSGKSYQVDLIPSSNGNVTLDLPANSVDDLVNNSVQNPSANQLTLEYNNNPSISVLVPAANTQVQGSSFNISGTSPTNGMVIYLFTDNNNDGVADNNTALASVSVNEGSWALAAPVTLGNANDFLVGLYNQATQSIEIIDIPTITEITNFAPVISGSPSNTAIEDSVYTFTPAVTDTNSSDVQTFSINIKPSWATFSTLTGALTGTPTNADVGTTAGIVISVTDAANASDSLAAFSLTVSNTNDAPVITGTPASTVAEDAAYSFIPTVSDVDAGDTQIFSINIKPSWATFSASTGGLTGTPTNVDVGITSGIVISVTDAANATVSLAAFSLTVTNSNDAPIISGMPATKAVEDAAYSFIPTVSDVDAGDTQSFSINIKPSWATFSASTGALIGTPTNADVGTTAGIVISVKDAANVTVSLSAFSITVTNSNDAPVITGTPATTVAEDAAYSFIPTVSDVDAGDTQSFSITNKPGWATFSASTGALTGTPKNVDVGTTSGIVISVADTATASDSLAAFSLTVSNTNDAPVITGTPATTVEEDAAYSFIPTVTDDIGDTQSFSITNKPGWAAFSTSTGALTGTPSRTDAADYADIVISVTDSTNAVGSLLAFTITVTNTNEAPVADAQTLSLEEDSELTIILSAEDFDEDELTYAILTEPMHGSLVQSTDNIWIYAANTNFNGADNFTYKAMDAEADSEPVTVELTINPVNDAPVAQDDNIVLTYSESGSYNLDVLNNDSDVDGDVLSIINARSAIGNASIEAGELIFQIQGVFEGEIKLQYAISDGNAVKDNDNSKANVTLVFDNHIDALLPVITLPQDIDINATALFTKVDLGVATAIDSEGGSVPVSLVDGITRFAPGNNLVYWQAQDSDGFKRVVTQRVTVQPLVNIAVDSLGTEGAHYKVAVHLNGESPTYPVIIPYSVSGDSDSNDHDLVLGELIIDSGLLGYIEFDTFSDGVVEADEEVVITLDDSVNLGAKSVFTLTMTEGNLAPQASITVSQDNEQRTLIDKTLGEVVITSEVFDANNDDNHSYTWMSVSGVLVDSDAEDTSFTFDPTNVATGQQILSLNVTDNNESPLSTVVFVYLDIVEALPTLTNIDSDGDLIPDNAEGYGDIDDDGIADYLDNNNSRCNIQTSEISQHELYLIETEPSTCLRRGINTASNQSGALLLRVDEVINDNEATNSGGVFDFILSGLPVAGQSISLVLPQRLPIPENAIYRKLTSDKVWVEFAVDTNNYYSSAVGEIGYCPAPNDEGWTLGLTAGHWCVQLTLEDGGLNDDDGVANGRIVDPSGVAVFNNNNTLPEIMSEQVVTTQNKSVTIDVLANDIDSDGDSLSITSANVDFGNVTIVDQKLHYQPSANFFGLATIIYGVSDSNNGTGFGDVAINVIENTAPVTVDDSATTDDRTAITIDVLANDTDVDNDKLTLVSVSAEQGSIIISNNMLAYTPLAGFDGVDSVIYHISDNNGGESQGQVAVTVNAYETIIITNKSSGGSFGSIILLLGSIMLFIRQKSTLVMSKAARGKALMQCLSLWVLFSLSISLSSYAAQTQKTDTFIKAELGQAKAKVSEISKQVPVGVITQIDNKATSWSLGIGTNITNDWSVTLSYVDMGEGSLAIMGDTLIVSEYHQSVAKIVPVLVKGVGLNGHYYFLQSEQYNVSVLFGVLIWDSDVVSAYENQHIDHHNDGIDMYYGIEGTYKIDEVWGVNSGIKRYKLDVNDVDIAYLGLTYKF